MNYHSAPSGYESEFKEFNADKCAHNSYAPHTYYIIYTDKETRLWRIGKY